MTRFVSSIFSRFFRLLYPRTCVVCGDVLVDGELFLCSACLSGLPLNEGVDEEADKVLAGICTGCFVMTGQVIFINWYMQLSIIPTWNWAYGSGKCWGSG